MITQRARLAGMAAVALASALLAAPAVAQSERVAVHTDWSVFTGSNPRECYIVSPPTASVARRGGEVVDVDRGDIRLFVTFRPDEGASGEVSYTSGYPFRADSTVRVSVGGETYQMSIGSGEADRWAWPATPAEDERLVAAFRRGAEATVTGVSGRGTETTDTFSLLGFTAALEDAAARCR